MNNKHGFTLIELLVVVLIIGILAAIALPQYQKAVMKNRYVQLIVRADALFKAGEMFFLENGRYPLDITELSIDITQGGVIQRTDATAEEHLGVVFPDHSVCATNPYAASCGLKKNNTYFVSFIRFWSRNTGHGTAACCAYAGIETEKICLSLGGKNKFMSGTIPCFEL